MFGFNSEELFTKALQLEEPWYIENELKKLARTIGMKMENIINYYEYRITNATLEGINSIIQLAKSRARGFKNIENFKTIIYLTSGKLDISV